MDTNVHNKIMKMLADILEISEEEISLDSSLFDDLGLESVDMLALHFRIEKEFGITISTDELWNFDDEDSENGFIVDDKLTETGLQEIKKQFSFTDVSAFESGMPLFDLYSLITPKLIGDFVLTKLQ